MEEMTRLFNLDFQLLHDTVLLAIAIFFLFLALSYLLFNPVRKMLKDRQEKIATDIDTALADKKDAAALKAEYEAKLKNIDKEAEQILSEARQKALTYSHYASPDYHRRERHPYGWHHIRR